MNKTVETCLAMSVAALFAAACDKDGESAGGPAEAADPSQASGESTTAMPAPQEGKVQCLGIHDCKGKSACHVVGAHACAGQNECKGKGWIQAPAVECQAKGGKILDS